MIPGLLILTGLLNPTPPPPSALKGGGVSSDAFAEIERHLAEIYIPNKIVFYAVRQGDYDATAHDLVRARLTNKGIAQARELRKLFNNKTLGLAFYDATYSSRDTAIIIRRGLSAQVLKQLYPRLASETFEQFRTRVRVQLMAIAQMGYQDSPPLLVASASVINEVAFFFREKGSAGILLLKPGEFLEIRYDHALNRLVAKRRKL